MSRFCQVGAPWKHVAGKYRLIYVVVVHSIRKAGQCQAWYQADVDPERKRHAQIQEFLVIVSNIIKQ